MTRQEHLQWAKDRAFEYCDNGSWQSAWASFVSDMSKHGELKDHLALEMGTIQIVGGLICTAGQMRRFIEGFN